MMLVFMVGFFLMVVEFVKEGGFLIVFMGIKGFLIVFIVVFVIVNVYKVCVKNNVIICMFEEVLLNIF